MNALVPWALAVLAAGAFACSDDDASVTAAPVQIHGQITLEPPRLGLGDLAWVEWVVVTPPDHRVLPVKPPEEIPGVWLLDAQRPAVESQGERRIHRTRVRIRAREIGSHQWPAQEVIVEGPDGEKASLDLEGRPFEVLALLPLSERTEPYGFRTPEAQGPERGPWAPAAAGALFALAVLAAISFTRKRLAARAARRAAFPGDDTPSWRAARQALASAAERFEHDPSGSADQVAAALRQYVSRRARLPAVARTTEELAALAPPSRLRSAWPDLLDLLRRLDRVRFPGGHWDEARRAALATSLAEAGEFVARTEPSGRLE